MADTSAQPRAVVSSHANCLQNLKIKECSKIIKSANDNCFTVQGQVDFDLRISESLTIPLRNVPTIDNLKFDLILGFPLLSDLGFRLLPKNNSYFILNDQKIRLSNSESIFSNSYKKLS